MSGSTRFEILRRLLAAVADQLVFDHLTFVERGQASALDRGDMDEYVFAAILRLNESIAFRRVEPFHGASSHLGLLCVRKRNRDRTTIVRSPIRSQRCLWEATPGGARQNKAKLEYRDCTRFSRGIQPHDVVSKGSSPLEHFSIRLTLVACVPQVSCDGIVAGRIMKAMASPQRMPWMWTLAFGYHEDRKPIHGYAPTREEAMAAFAKSWRRE